MDRARAGTFRAILTRAEPTTTLIGMATRPDQRAPQPSPAAGLEDRWNQYRRESDA
jgi:hypothetical protein